MASTGQYGPKRLGRAEQACTCAARLWGSPAGCRGALTFGRVCKFHTGYAKSAESSEIRLRRGNLRTTETFAVDLRRSAPFAILCCTAADRFPPVLRHLISALRPAMQSAAARSYPGFSPVAPWYRW